MTSRDPFDAMWAEALDMPEQAQRLHRRSFQPRGGTLLVVAERPLPPSPPHQAARLRHLEISYGRFERHIDLPAGLFELAERTLVSGCLALTLRKLQ